MNNIKGLLMIIFTAAAALLVSCGFIYIYTYYCITINNTTSSTPGDATEFSSAEYTESLSDTLNDIPSETSADVPAIEETSGYSYPQDYITVDDSYFEDAVFLGDSRMQGFIKYCGISGLRAYAYVGLNVETYFTKKVFNVGNSKFSASEALELDRSFKKVYLMFGTNELGWAFPDIFIEKYGSVIDHIKECNPDAVIFLESVMPVSRNACQKGSYLKNETVWKYNELLKQLADDKEVYYLDFANTVADENGILPDEAATDGIHLNKEYVQKCLEYMRTHAVPVPEPDIITESESE